MKYLLLGLSVLLTACGGSPPNPGPIPGPYWVGMYGTPVTPDGILSFGEPHYIVKAPIPLGQTLTIRFRIDGADLYPTEGPGPAQVRLFLWRQGDNMSCAGSFAAYRMWSTGVVINGAGEYTLTANIDPSQWTDCLGQHVTAEVFADLLSHLFAVGFTFGGEFAGHGVRSRGQTTFTLLSFG